MIAQHFANHRIAWSRAIAATVLLIAVFEARPAILAGWPAELSELFGYALLVTAALWRIWCVVFIGGTKDGALATSGPYSVVRNPLYLGNFIGAVGFGFVIELPYLALLLALAFAALYPAVVKNEEARLTERFGERYLEYCARVPRWIPDWSLYREPDTVLVSPLHIRKGILDAMWFLWAYGAWELIERLRETGLVKPLF